MNAIRCFFRRFKSPAGRGSLMMIAVHSATVIIDHILAGVIAVDIAETIRTCLLLTGCRW